MFALVNDMGVFELVSIAKEYKAPIGWMVAKPNPPALEPIGKRSSKTNQPITNEQLSYIKPLKKKKVEKLILYAQLDHDIPRTF